jgi:uncharacterized protein YhfF
VRTTATDEMWNAYCKHSKIWDQDYEVVAFGDSPEMADKLGQLILNGPKRATVGLYRDFEIDLTTLPKVGGHVVVIDGQGRPLCVFQTVEVRVGPLNSVDEAFAWDEGEGDRSRNWWLDAHTAFFKRQAKAEGFEFTPDIETVFERFKVVWPLVAQGADGLRFT